MYRDFRRGREKGAENLFEETIAENFPNLGKPTNHEREQEKIGSEKMYRNKHKTSNKMAINTYLTIIILNASGLNENT